MLDRLQVPKPIDHDARPKAIRVAAQLLLQVLGVRVCVAKRRLALNPIDDAAAEHARHGQLQVGRLVVAAAPQIALVVEVHARGGGHVLHAHLVLLADALADYVRNGTVAIVGEQTGEHVGRERRLRYRVGVAQHLGDLGLALVAVAFVEQDATQADWGVVLAHGDLQQDVVGAGGGAFLVVSIKGIFKCCFFFKSIFELTLAEIAVRWR